MGVLTNLIGMKQAQDQKATQNALDALTLIYKDEKATPENKQWAADSIRDLTNTIFGGKKAGGGGGGGGGSASAMTGGGGKGKAGTGIGDIFHGVLSTLAKANPYTPSQNTKETLKGIGEKRPTGHLEMSEEEYQAKQDQLAQHQKEIEIRNNIREAAVKAQQKATENEEIYNTEYKRAIAGGATPRQAYERASSIAANKTPPDVLKDTTKKPSAGKNATIIGPDGKEFIGVSRQMEDGSTQLFKIGSTTPLDPATYSEKVKEPQDVSSLRGYEEDLKTLKDPNADPTKKEAAKLDLRDRAEKNKAVEVRIQTGQENLKTLQGGGGNAPPGKTGEAALEGQPEGIKNLVRQVATYKKSFPMGMAAGRPPWSTVAELLGPYTNGAYNEQKYKQAQQMRDDYTNTKGNATGSKILSLNTIAQHLGTFEQAVNALDNNDIQRVNTLLNALARETGQNEITDLNFAKTAIAAEMSTALKQSGATDQEIEAWRSQMNSSSSPKQFKGVIKKAYQLMAGRLRPMKEEYEGVMGTVDVPIVLPSSKILFDKHGIDPNTLEEKGQSQGEDKEYNGHTYHRDKPGDPWNLVK